MNAVRKPILSPTALVFLSIASTQLGSAIAKSLFDQLHPAAVAFLRVAFAAVMLMSLYRPQWRGLNRSNYRMLIGFGLALSLMNLSFYLAVDRIPLGIAVTVEFIGPLGVAVATSRRWLDLLWAALAALGIFLLAPISQTSTLDPLGILLALVAGGFWAAYIVMSARVGRVFSGMSGLALAMTVGAIVLAPVGVITGGSNLLNPHLLLISLGVALLSSALPYSFELEALRWIPMQVFGILLSLEPAAAALIAWMVLGETLSLRAILAVCLVTVAAAGTARFSHRRLPETAK